MILCRGVSTKGGSQWIQMKKGFKEQSLENSQEHEKYKKISENKKIQDECQEMKQKSHQWSSDFRVSLVKFIDKGGERTI